MLGLSLFALAACGGGGNSVVTTPVSTPLPTTYSLLQTITFPGVPPSAGVFSFDIGFVDVTAGQYYLADRNTKGVDVIKPPRCNT